MKNSQALAGQGQLSFSTIGGQLARIRAHLFWGLAVSVLVVLAITFFGMLTGTRLDHLTIDPADVFMMPAYYGVLSHFGVMCWSASAAICFLTSFVTIQTNRKVPQSFFFFSGMLSALMMFDDALLIHDRVFPDAIGIPETVVYVVYAVFVFGYLLKFAHIILTTDFLLLAIGMILLGGSVCMDMILPFTPLETFYEDCVKFAGIVFWAIYFFRTSLGSSKSSS